MRFGSFSDYSVDVLIEKAYIRDDGSKSIHQMHIGLPDPSCLAWQSLSFEPLCCSDEFIGCDFSMKIRLKKNKETN